MSTESANINQGRKISGIWLIPLLALALGAYLVIHAWWTDGPEIDIAFKTASGLEQGKTKIKYRNVDMGVVQKVRLSDDLEGIIATIKLDNQASPLLREDTRFWVVTARVGLGNISGLETLLSGAYIQLAPGSGEEGYRHFVALEQPPLTELGAPGLRLKLTSEQATSVSTGDTVLYNGYTVGRVESMEFDPTERKARYVIFVDAPYHELITSSVRFWDVSGISISADADGFKLETGSADTILLGGVSFGLPPGIGKGDPVEHNTEFKLFDSYDEILENPYRQGSHYVVSFDHSIKGLVPGAPVEYRGIPLGKVERIMLKDFLYKSAEQRRGRTGEPIPVLIYLEPARIQLPDRRESLASLHDALKNGIGHGMRASLETGNLLTGSKYVGIDYFENVEEAKMGSFMGYPSIPTIDTGLGQLQQKVTSILDMINALPLDETFDKANNALGSLDSALISMDKILASESTKGLPQELGDTLKELRESLASLSSETSTYQSVNSSLLKLNRSLANIETLTRTLASKPNALVLPSSETPDPTPEAKK
ncbi:MAG: paraquat-inducible protein B [Halioglobus sp.]